MKPNCRTCLFILVVCAVAHSDMIPTPGTQAVDPVFNAADLVCSGVVVSVDFSDERRSLVGDHSHLRRRAKAQVRIGDVYKGAQQQNDTIYLEYDDEVPVARSTPSVWKGETAVLFLRSIAPSTYLFEDQFMGVIPFKSVPEQAANSGIGKLQRALTDVALHGEGDDQVRAAQLLQGFQELSSATFEAMKFLAGSPDPAVALSGLAVLLKSRSPKAVKLLADYLGVQQKDHSVSEPVALISIGGELATLQDRGDLPALESLTASGYIVVRVGAMEALRRMKDPSSAPTLVRKLDDPDSNVRYLAGIALAETFGKTGDFTPSMYLYDKSPDFYIALWKQWARESGLGSAQ